MGRGAASILTYQLGRALVYALFGFVVGLLGAELGDGFTTAGAVFALAFGVTALGAAIFRWRVKAEGDAVRVAGPKPPGARKQGWLVRTVHGLIGERRGFAETLALGGLMAFLPCMITFWALSLAATTGSPLHGAGVMLVLVAMTTPMLLGVTLLPRLLRRLRVDRVQRVLMAISGAWLLMVGFAQLELVPHLHLPLELFGEHYVIMLW